MKIEVLTKEHGIRVSVDNLNSETDLTRWSILIYKILTLLQNKEACLITISPQNYSVGLELDSYQRLMRKNKEYLMNWNVVLTDKILHLIVDSEEFQRGLLFLILSNRVENILDTIDAIDSVGSINFDSLRVSIVIIEDDAKTLVLNYLNKEIENDVAQLVKSYI